MSTTLHSFMDIFETTIEDGDTSVQLNKIVIPLIQRDYAQGRIDKDINRVRSRFLQALYRAVTGEPITLDFVYGDIDEEGTMTPLDGQQRLTTLFLLHWYAAKKEKISDDKYAFLSRFSYETRYSARYFCAELVKFMPSFETTLSADIKNQAWFPFDWKDDPTISSMLVMLDAIDERFKDVPDIWEQLENKAITFYFLPIRDMGLTDELFRPGSYGKMSNDDVVNKPYMFSVMQTKTQWSQNTYMPYLKEADDDHLSRDEMGQYLVYDDVYIACENNSYGVYRNDDDSLTDTVTISQNEAGIDTEDRIIKLKKYIANMK